MKSLPQIFYWDDTSSRLPKFYLENKSNEKKRLVQMKTSGNTDITGCHDEM